MSYKYLQLKVGIFSALALALLTAGIGLLASGAFFGEQDDYVLYFEGSVAGLSVGAPVVFRGVPLGKVTSISLVANSTDNTFIIPVGIDIFEENIRHIIGGQGRVTDAVRDEMVRRMVERGMRARVATVSFLTGQARIELDFLPETSARYRSKDPSTEIPTVSSPLEEFSRALSKINIDRIAHNLLHALENFNKLITSEELQGTLTGFKRIADDAAAVAQELPALAASARQALQRIETAADRTAREVPKVSHDLSLALDNVARAADRADKLFLDASRLMSPNSATVRDVQSAAKELAEAARAIRGLAKTLERSPESLLRGKGGQQP
ncbi:MAG: MlaD family protein [Deltaproteobacteria bacterium]|jgi:paraquat-inducible protein B|nr:MlaD family protein [Deltaproteobacteria bacterium]